MQFHGNTELSTVIIAYGNPLQLHPQKSFDLNNTKSQQMQKQADISNQNDFYMFTNSIPIQITEKIFNY